MRKTLKIEKLKNSFNTQDYSIFIFGAILQPENMLGAKCWTCTENITMYHRRTNSFWSKLRTKEKKKLKGIMNPAGLVKTVSSPSN